MVGGHDSTPHHYVLRSGRRRPRVLKTKEEGIAVRPGDVFVVKSAGGGGWGDPARRTAEARARDVRDGIVSARK
jgi:N-methylhydantoinase B